MTCGNIFITRKIIIFDNLGVPFLFLWLEDIFAHDENRTQSFPPNYDCTSTVNKPSTQILKENIYFFHFLVNTMVSSNTVLIQLEIRQWKLGELQAKWHATIVLQEENIYLGESHIGQELN
ncbi:hypothetical protein ACJX0J_007101 [Zea mays]